jgi:hypothetical protein
MNLVIKSMWTDSATIDLKNHTPDDPNCFGLWIEFRVGIEGQEGADDFKLYVCTPEWIKRKCTTFVWGRHILIASQYNIDLIKKEIEKRIAECKEDDWISSAKKISRFAAWEFEDYES